PHWSPPGAGLTSQARCRSSAHFNRDAVAPKRPSGWPVYWSDAYRPDGSTPASTWLSPSTAAATGTPTSTSRPRLMSITLYFQNGAPAGGSPRCPSQANTEGCSPGSTSPRVSMVTWALIATYGWAARSMTSGSPSIRDLLAVHSVGRTGRRTAEPGIIGPRARTVSPCGVSGTRNANSV